MAEPIFLRYLGPGLNAPANGLLSGGVGHSIPLPNGTITALRVRMPGGVADGDTSFRLTIDDAEDAADLTIPDGDDEITVSGLSIAITDDNAADFNLISPFPISLPDPPFLFWIYYTPSSSSVAADIHAATGKTTPVDADELGIADSAASYVLKKLTWANLKATAKSYFDTLYLTTANIDDTAYDATSWNGDTTHAPSKNAVRDKIESLGAGTVSDTVYGAGWNGDTTVAPSKNAVYDKIETLQPLDSDLTTIAGLTATTDNFLQAKSSAWASRTIAQVSADLQGTGSAADAVGFRGIPQNSQSTAYTTVMADAGKEIFHPSSDANARTFTIDSNANVAYPIGTVILFTNDSANAVTIAITSDTLVLVGAGTTGSRTLAQYGQATARKVGTTRWYISGTNLT